MTFDSTEFIWFGNTGIYNGDIPLFSRSGSKEAIIWVKSKETGTIKSFRYTGYNGSACVYQRVEFILKFEVV